ncbi:MAG: hypothetical protein JNM76_11675 [Betaproteobacteria bacterium]|nr:hypothetical protein [Betaproteobacteria bacterium]
MKTASSDIAYDKPSPKGKVKRNFSMPIRAGPLRLVGRRSLQSCGGRHLLATVRTVSAHFHTLVHVAYLLTTLRAGVADFRAGSTHGAMQGRLGEQEIAGDLAKLRAIHHEFEMLFFNVLAPNCRQCVMAIWRQILWHSVQAAMQLCMSGFV